MPPLQFSFTFYDLEGHHGKITKDDIVGIVYTIYESLGKSVVVPHCGSRTINVRLTVSPEGRNTITKNKKIPTNVVTSNGVKSSITTTTCLANQTLSHHLHRHQLRKVSKLDEENDDKRSNMGEETQVNANIMRNDISSIGSNPLDIWKTNVKQRCQSTNQINMIGMDRNTANYRSVCNHILKESRNICTATECTSEAGAENVTDGGNSCTIPTEQSINGYLIGQHQQKTATSDAYLKHITSPRLMILKKTHKQKVKIGSKLLFDYI